MNVVRDLFERVLPAWLEEHGAGEGFRCRFHVAGAGAWDVSLGVVRPWCIDAHAAPGGYDAVVEIDAAEWGRADARVKTSVTAGTPPRAADLAREMLAALFRGPPFVWPASLRIMPVGAAFLRASPEELRAAVAPFARVERERRWTINPFTQKREMRDVIVEPELPRAPPLPFVHAVIDGGRAQWWEPLIALYNALVLEADLDYDDDAFDVAFPEVARAGASLTIRETPQPLVRAMAEASDETWRTFGETLGPAYFHGLRRMGAFARSASSLFFWGLYEDAMMSAYGRRYR